MPRPPSRPSARPSLCMVCGKRPSVGLYLDERGWYLIGCSAKFCIAPAGCEAYEYVMDIRDFLACRRMIADNLRKAMSGEDGASYGTMYLGSVVKF